MLLLRLALEGDTISFLWFMWFLGGAPRTALGFVCLGNCLVHKIRFVENYSLGCRLPTCQLQPAQRVLPALVLGPSTPPAASCLSNRQQPRLRLQLTLPVSADCWSVLSPAALRQSYRRSPAQGPFFRGGARAWGQCPCMCNTGKTRSAALHERCLARIGLRARGE